ncbi:(2Fe-2S)-binding protein [Paenibacillus sp. N1-5-1-14]|uniref:(2Fe-2S)-binding protein n=1 Tax=Paenibacillus radicibacter TaxID=2972488 RepID=UPI002158CC1C|nr:(2Fe-2S)-binding protein [Paenibacillus radicibacter]MCR8644787.1 (2Fe-2S)-binding protein [Paenibacillus radicibacter]
MDQSSIIICRCEEVSLGQIVDTAKQYQCSSREVKLRTRAGMGFCGGRTCRLLIDTIIEQTSGVPTPHETTLKYQPPVRPVTFHNLGGNES